MSEIEFPKWTEADGWVGWQLGNMDGDVVTYKITADGCLIKEDDLDGSINPTCPDCEEVIASPADMVMETVNDEVTPMHKTCVRKKQGMNAGDDVLNFIRKVGPDQSIMGKAGAPLDAPENAAAFDFNSDYTHWRVATAENIWSAIEGFCRGNGEQTD